MAQAIYSTDEDLAAAQAARRARTAAPAQAAPPSQASITDPVAQKVAQIKANPAAVPNRAGVTLSDPATTQWAEAQQARPIGTAEAATNAPDAAFTRQNAPLNTTPAQRAGNFAPESGAAPVRPSITDTAPQPPAQAPAQAAPAEAAAAPARPSIGSRLASGAKSTGAAVLAGELLNTAPKVGATPTEDYTARGIPDVGTTFARGARAVTDTLHLPEGISSRAEDAAHGVGDIATRTGGALVDYGDRLIDTAKDVGHYIASGGVDTSVLKPGAKPSAGGGVIPSANAATGDARDEAELAATMRDVNNPGSPNSPLKAPSITFTYDQNGKPTQSGGGNYGFNNELNKTATGVPGISKITGAADGAPIYTNIPGMTATELAANGGKLRPGVSSISDEAFTHPAPGVAASIASGGQSTPALGEGGTPAPAGTGSGGGAMYDPAERERRDILNSLQEDQAARRKQLTKLVGEAEYEAQAGHKRRASILSNLAGLYDRGTPDYAAYMRGNRNVYQTPEQRDQELARAEQERANAQAARVTAAQKSHIFQLQQQAAEETDPKKRASILEQIDNIGGNHGRRYQFPSVISGYDDLGRPQHQTYRADTYTGDYHQIEAQ